VATVIDMLPSDVQVLLTDQTGVVARRQLVGVGARPHDIKRWLRRRELATIHPGVYVNHSGDLSWQQRAWAAVLACGEGAALWRESALGAHADGPHRHGPLHVAVPASRHPDTPAGVVVHRIRSLEGAVQWGQRPPRQRYDEAVIEAAAATARPIDAVGILTGAVGSRRTTAERLLEVCAARARLRQRDWIESVLHDAARGTCSVLEHGYLDQVERPHGLPVASRQLRDGIASVVYRDAAYAGDVLVELDGLQHSDADQRDADLERDLDAALTGRTTVRLGWRQVFSRPCRTAAKVGRLLALRGWGGTLVRCSPTCSATA